MSVVKTYYLDMVHFYALGSITTGDGKWKVVMPDDGEIQAYGGHIRALGSGGGTSTDLQIRNETMTPDRDYFITLPTFEVNSADNLLEGGELISSPVFRRGDVLALDIDAISTGPADAEVWLLVGMHHEVSQ